jgi:hypothetical protein
VGDGWRLLVTGIAASANKYCSTFVVRMVIQFLFPVVLGIPGREVYLTVAGLNQLSFDPSTCHWP